MVGSNPASRDTLIAAFGSEMPRLALAWLGEEHALASLQQAWAAAELRAVVEGAVEEAAGALQAELGWSAPQTADWVAESLGLVTEWVSGGATPVGQPPARALRREGPLTAAALLAWHHGIAPHHIARAIAAGLRSRESKCLATAASPGKAVAAITAFCGLRREDELIPLALQAYLSSQPEEWKRDLTDRAFHIGFDYEVQYRGCGQATLTAILDTLGVEEDGLVRGASPIASGLAMLGDAPCGGFLGAALAMGWFAGRRRSHLDGDREEKYRCFRMTAALRRRYLQAYGGLVCSEIQRKLFGRSYDLWDEQDKEAFDAAGAHTIHCTQVVGRATQWAVEVLCQPPSAFQGVGPPRPAD